MAPSVGQGHCDVYGAAWRPPKMLRSRPAYDIVIPDSAAFDGVPFSDDEELTPGADEDIQSPLPLQDPSTLPLQDPVALPDDASYICQIAGYEGVGRRRTSETRRYSVQSVLLFFFPIRIICMILLC